MHALFRRRRSPAAFTLVELLTVIVIIGILAGLLMVAANGVMVKAKRTVVLTQLTELGRALETHKGEHGDYPPDFAGVNLPDGDPIGDAARARVLAHLRKAFPKYQLGPGTPYVQWLKFCNDVNSNYDKLNINPATFDASAGLVFWLGGLPERNVSGDWNKPRGFHSDPRMPFKPGLPRTDPPFKFAADDLLLAPGMVQFCSHRLREKTPVVYFRSYRSAAGRFEYGQDVGGGTFVPKFYAWTDQYGDSSVCMPYLAPPQDPTLNFATANVVRPWRNLETYQIICAGFDGGFGDGPPFRFTKSGDGFTEGDFDNLTNLYTVSDLEGELK